MNRYEAISDKLEQIKEVSHTLSMMGISEYSHVKSLRDLDYLFQLFEELKFMLFINEEIEYRIHDLELLQQGHGTVKDGKVVLNMLAEGCDET